MAGIKTLRRLQLGKEATKGTKVNADIVWRGTGTIEDGSEVRFVDEDVGYIGGALNTYIPFVIGYLHMDPTPATFEHLPHILEAGIRTDAPAQDGTKGSGYIYEYILPTTQSNTIVSYTIEAGDNQQEEEMGYGFVTDFTLTGAPKEAIMVSAEWTGRQVATGSFTAAPAFTAVEEMFFNKTSFYVDTTGGTFGGNIKANTLLGWELNVNTGWIPKFTADGELYFAFEANVGPEVTLTLTMEHNATAVTAVADWRAETPKLYRIKVEGSALTTASVYTYKTMIIDLAAKWESMEVIGEIDGNDIRRGVLRGGRDETAADFGKIIIVNELAALP